MISFFSIEWFELRSELEVNFQIAQFVYNASQQCTSSSSPSLRLAGVLLYIYMYNVSEKNVNFDWLKAVFQ